MTTNTILIIPDKPDIERDGLAQLWEAEFGPVMRVGKFWIKPETSGNPVALYGNDSFCLVLAQILGLQMISPQDEIIAGLGMPWLKRQMQVRALEEIDQIDFPIFAKPATPKLFKAQVYQTKEDLLAATDGLKASEKLMLSDIVAVEKEVRAFVLNRQLMDAAFYEGEGDIAAVKAFAQQFLAETEADLPKTFVMDLGYNDNLGWFLIEFNSSWGAGLNNCDPGKVLHCIKAATIN